jgi:molybdopterin converting factor small subunit
MRHVARLYGIVAVCWKIVSGLNIPSDAETLIEGNRLNAYKRVQNIEKIAVRLFAGAREQIDKECIEIVVSFPVSVGQLKQLIQQQHPPLAGFVRHGRIAVDNHFACDDLVFLSTKDAQPTIALIPPVSGG